MSRGARCWSFLLLALMLAAPLHAQRVQVRGESRHPAARMLREILARGAYRVLARDTVLPADFHTDGDLVVVGATVHLEGSVEGSVALVEGTLHVRPGARVAGGIAALRGEVLVSGLASTGEVSTLVTGVELERGADEGEAYIVGIEAPPRPARLRPAGPFGLGPATYDRVDGLTVGAGARLRLGGGEGGAELRGRVAYRTERAAPGGSLELGLPLGGGVELTARAERATRTNEAWIRGDLVNSVAAVLAASDVRNYYESDVASLQVERRRAQALVQGEGFIGPRLGLVLSHDRSLPTGSPWSLLGDGDDWRENPPIDDGRILSLLLGTRADWRGQTSRFTSDLVLEWAPPGASDTTFAQLRALGSWEMRALRGHGIIVRARVLHPLGRRGAPRQRWSLLGGSGTLPTLEVGAFHGDHLVFVESEYTIPLLGLQLPVLGAPELRLAHALGGAWATGSEPPPWEQSLGLGLRFSLFHATLYLDPAVGTGSTALDLGARLPF